MNNGMFVEMCAYVANRDTDRVKNNHNSSEAEEQAKPSREGPELQTALKLARFGRFVKNCLQSISKPTLKDTVKKSQSRF